MEYFAAWYNAVFYIPLAVGMVLAACTAAGMGDMHHGADLDGDGHPDHESGHDASERGGLKLLSLIGVGKVPLLLVAMMACLIFGTVGLCLNFFLGSRGAAGFPASLTTAAVTTFSLTGAFSRLVSRLVPSLETSAKGRSDLIGSVGKATTVYSVDSVFGAGCFAIVQVEKDGDVHSVKVRMDKPIAGLASVLITEHDPETDSYSGCEYENPLGGERKA